MGTETQLFIDGFPQNKYVWNIALAVCKAPYFCDPKAAFDIQVTSDADGNFYDMVVYEDQTVFQSNSLGKCVETEVILQHAASDATACVAVPSNMVILPGTPGTVHDYMESVHLHKAWYNSLTGNRLYWTKPVDTPSQGLYAQVRNVDIAALPQELARVACKYRDCRPSGVAQGFHTPPDTPYRAWRPSGVAQGLHTPPDTPLHYNTGEI